MVLSSYDITEVVTWGRRATWETSVVKMRVTSLTGRGFITNRFTLSSFGKIVY